jgi:glycosyltransferase involved in cell wall biosynthesis
MVDAIITSSEALRERKETYGRPTFVVKNGVDADLFARTDSATGAPAYPKPTIGYVGSIDDRLDYDLLSAVIQGLPGYRFQFIGRVTESGYARRLQSFPNVEMVEPQPMRALPGFVQDMDLGIIPFVKNAFTRGIYPLKINEYLAAGIPVVMTDFASLPEFADIAGVVSSAEAFVAMARESISTDTPEKREGRVAFARKNSWRARAEAMETIINQTGENHG